MSLVSGKYHENKVFAVMEMASICMKIHHVFGGTFLPGNSVEHFLQLYSIAQCPRPAKKNPRPANETRDSRPATIRLSPLLASEKVGYL